MGGRSPWRYSQFEFVDSCAVLTPPDVHIASGQCPLLLVLQSSRDLHSVYKSWKWLRFRESEAPEKADALPALGRRTPNHRVKGFNSPNSFLQSRTVD